MKNEVNWRKEIDNFSSDQRLLIEGGVLSRRFSSLPLTLSHPVFIGSFYGFLLSLILLLPLGLHLEWNIEIWFETWIINSLSIIVMLSILGGISSIIINFSKRMPVSVPRKLVYLSPFLGLIILTTSIGLKYTESWIISLGLFMMISPGPTYIHLSWAPRWRLLESLEEGSNPFEGIRNNTPLNEDLEISEIIESFSEE
ncbi:MAG: hypothetical protein CMB56_000360 [Methanobacteriota archaeon]|nr:MAG: hypothetical protein CMB56_000360 [Euryarchaeota archaeon]